MATHSVFLPEESHGQRSLGGYSPWGCKESDMTQRLNNNTHHDKSFGRLRAGLHSEGAPQSDTAQLRRGWLTHTEWCPGPRTSQRRAVSPPWPGGALEAEHPTPARPWEGDQATDTRAPGPVQRDGDGRRVGSRRPQQGLLRDPGAGRGPRVRGKQDTRVSDPAPGWRLFSTTQSARGTLSQWPQERNTGPACGHAGIHWPFSIRTKHEPGTARRTEPRWLQC